MLVTQFKLLAVPHFRTQIVPDNVHESRATDSRVITGVALLKKLHKIPIYGQQIKQLYQQLR
jgi:hypothetical protein